MDIIEAIKTRKSIRGFKPTPVPREILRDILETASHAPSGVNAQPWGITVVTGEVLEKIRQGNLQKFIRGEPVNPELPIIRTEGKFRQRQVEAAVRLYKLMGIAKEDRQGRAEWDQRGYRFFDAPAGFIISADKSIELAHSQFDVGLLTQTICLAAMKHGLGTCIEHQAVMFPDVIRRFTSIPDSHRLVTGIAIGYPDLDLPANQGQTSREPLDSFVTWLGFD